MQQAQDEVDMGRGQLTPSSFSEAPCSWHYACELRELARAPLGLAIGGREFVLFIDGTGRTAAMDRRCAHMGADLSKGHVANGRIKCPLHDWEYDRAGRCVHVPATNDIPPFARQQAYPTAVVGSHVLLFNRAESTFDAPFFDGIAPAALLDAAPFEFEVEMPWHLVGANGFDLQHFRAAHGRLLVGEPLLTRPSPFAYRIVATFEVTGSTLRDRFTRLFSGRRVKMTVTSWCGSLVFVTAEFARMTTYGMVCIRPMTRTRSHVRIFTSIAGRTGPLKPLGSLDVAIRRGFIRAFLGPDIEAGAGIQYFERQTIPADQVLNGYLRWLAAVQKDAPINQITSSLSAS